MTHPPEIPICTICNTPMDTETPFDIGEKIACEECQIEQGESQ